jgi:uncharacterized protein
MDAESSVSKMILTQIWIYPVKSLGGYRVKTATVAQKGLQYDRRWMLVDEFGNFMTQRMFPQMALFKISGEVVGKEIIFIVTKDKDSIELPGYFDTKEVIQSKVWDDDVIVNEVSNTHSDWFSHHLGMKCRLVYFPEDRPRPVDPRYEVNKENVSLADGYPYLIIGEKSLEDLNSKMELPVPMDRFRPNMVFSGGLPYEEDKWRDFTIGNNRFMGTKPCSRCVLTTINQETAEKGKEPLRTLAKYRKWDNKIFFGQNVIAVDHGTINEGDEIQLG